MNVYYGKLSLKSVLGKDYKQKNFFRVDKYNKAFGIMNADGSVTLQSYWTDILKFNPTNKTFQKFWDGYSLTTSRHIHDFLSTFGCRGYCKKDWLSLPCNETIKAER